MKDFRDQVFSKKNSMIFFLFKIAKNKSQNKWRKSTRINAPISVKPEGGGEVGHKVGILTFSEKIYQNPHPRAKIVKSSRNIWLTSLLLYKIERSNA